jgi:hypothetical protein
VMYTVRRQDTNQVLAELLHHRKQGHAHLTLYLEGGVCKTQAEPLVRVAHLIVDEGVIHEGHGVHDPTHCAREGPIRPLSVVLPGLVGTLVDPGGQRPSQRPQG